LVRFELLARNTNLRGRLSTVNLLKMIRCFVRKVNNKFQHKKQHIYTSNCKEVNRTEPSPSVRLPWLKDSRCKKLQIQPSHLKMEMASRNLTD
jgi:hypothetical protein